MKIKMLMDAGGCPDGIKLVHYKKDEVYDLPADLAGCFISRGEGEVVKEKEAAPENKAEAPAVEKKAKKAKKAE